MEKLADGLQRLDEESLLHVVQLVHDHKSAETYAKNDVESESPPGPLPFPVHSPSSPASHRPGPPSRR